MKSIKYTYRLLFSLITLLLVSTIAWCATPSNVLVIINENSPASREIGAYYVAKRKIPAKNVVRIKCNPDDTIGLGHYREQIEKPVKAYIAKKNLKYTIDYLVLTKGMPIRILDGGRSLDTHLMCMDKDYMQFGDLQRGIPNPYFGKNEHFSYRRYGFYLATRLDGYSAKDAKALVDRSIAARPVKGDFLLDTASNRNSEGYGMVNEAMRQAHNTIVQKGYISTLEDTSEFAGGRTNLMGYFSWGSNDSSYDELKFKSNRFRPGAIAEIAVSVSIRSFSRLEGPSQSQIVDLIASGVTGVKGYVTEPYLAAIADPNILFDRYLSGNNLAESFYMASHWIFWKDIVVGDPLCSPYAKKR